MVVSFMGSPPAASELNTPPVQEAPAQPERMGIRPVSMAAREGEQTWKALYHCNHGEQSRAQGELQASGEQGRLLPAAAAAESAREAGSSSSQCRG